MVYWFTLHLGGVITLHDEEVKVVAIVRPGYLSHHSRFSSGLRICDHALEAGQEPPIGAHLVTARRAYTHHGIYAGQGHVLQYGGGLRRDPIEEVPLSRFSHGRQVWIRLGERGLQDRPDVVRRARSRLGEDRYHVLRNNCEHFCEWCVRGQHRSYQVDELVSRVGKGWLGFVESLARIFRENQLQRYRVKSTSRGRRDRTIPQAGNSLSVCGTPLQR
jgi:hypothetical protein